jgi:hypothetical protein
MTEKGTGVWRECESEPTELEGNSRSSGVPKEELKSSFMSQAILRSSRAQPVKFPNGLLAYP